MWYRNDWSQRHVLAVLMGGMVWGLASNAQAETEYWYYNGELTTPADSRAVLSPYRLPAGQVPKAFAKPKLGGWDWQKRQQAHLKLRQLSLQSPVPVRPPLVGLASASMRSAPTVAAARALPFWPDIPVITVR